MNPGGMDNSSTLYLAPIRGITDQIYRNALVHHFRGMDQAVAPFVATQKGNQVRPTHLAECHPEHNDLLDGYRQRLSGPTHQLQHLRAHWEYLQHAVPNGDKLLRKIRKAETVSDYSRLVESVFRNPWADRS